MIKGNKKKNLYKKIKKLTESNCRGDLDIAKELIIGNMAEFSQKQFDHLSHEYYMNDLIGGNEEITIADIHKHYYDKRQEEIRANKTGDTKKSVGI